jgi:hypothetical protein
MLVPEAAMNENHFPTPGKDEIGLPRNLFEMRPETVSKGMQCSPHE